MKVTHQTDLGFFIMDIVHLTNPFVIRALITLWGWWPFCFAAPFLFIHIPSISHFRALLLSSDCFLLSHYIFFFFFLSTVSSPSFRVVVVAILLAGGGSRFCNYYIHWQTRIEVTDSLSLPRSLVGQRRREIMEMRESQTISRRP